MKLEQVEQVMEVAKTGTFSQAARNLFMSQPNLSLSIKQLEEELNCQIFLRTSEGVILTEDGKELMEHMAVIYNQCNILKEFQRVKETNRLTLRIGMSNLNGVVPCFVDISKKYMSSPINFTFLNYTMISTIIDRVLTCQVDFALISMMEPYARNIISKLRNHHIEYHLLAKNPVYAVVGPENEFYHAAQPISIRDIGSQTMITFGNALEDPYSALLEVSNIRLETKGKVDVNNCYLFYEMVQNTPVMGLVSCNKNTFSLRERWHDLRLLEIADSPLFAETGWIKLRRMPLTDIASELLEELATIF